MPRKPTAINTVDAAPISLNDAEIATLDSIVKHWNAAKNPDKPDWNVQTVLAELAVLTIRSMHGDYGAEERTPTFQAPPPRIPEPPA